MTTPTIGSLFSGYGGLDMAIEQVTGGRTVWVCDNDPGAAKILAHNQPGVPNLGDITAIDWHRIPPVDVITGGFPCQDLSLAGKRVGMGGHRSSLWSHMAAAVDVLRPSLVVAENVRGLLSAEANSEVDPCPWCVGDGPTSDVRALGAVLADLADLGYDAAWFGLTAASVGAPHGRFRVFVAAWPAEDADGATRGERRESASRQAEGGRAWADVGRRDRASAADAQNDGPARGHSCGHEHALPRIAGHSAFAATDSESDGRLQGRPEPAGQIRRSDAAQRGDAATADADDELQRPISRTVAASATSGERSDAEPDRRSADRDGGTAAAVWGTYEPAIRRWEHTIGRSAPQPTVLGLRAGRSLNPQFVEWMMGLPAGHVTGVPDLSRNEQLKALGNGVVPQQAAAALVWLLHITGLGWTP